MSSPSDARARAVLCVGLRRGVHARFTVTLERLADRILDLARRHAPAAPPESVLDRFVVDDLYLATACADGEDAAWTEFGERFFGFIRDFSARRLREPLGGELADDIIAALWQRRKIAQYEGRSTLRTWLGAIVVHAAINAAKVERAAAAHADAFHQAETHRQSQTTSADPFVAGAAARELGELVTRALARLPDDDRLLVLLYYEQGLTLDRISPMFALSKAALSRRLDRIRRDLRHTLDALASSSGASADDLRRSIDLSRVELDLSAFLGQMKNKRPNVV